MSGTMLDAMQNLLSVSKTQQEMIASMKSITDLHKSMIDAIADLARINANELIRQGKALDKLLAVNERS